MIKPIPIPKKKRLQQSISINCPKIQLIKMQPSIIEISTIINKFLLLKLHFLILIFIEFIIFKISSS